MDFNTFKNLLPQELFTEDENSVFVRFIKSILVTFQTYQDNVDQYLKNIVFDTMDEDTVLIWEQLLGIPTNTSLSLQTRRGRVKSYIAGVDNTALDVKNVIIGFAPFLTPTDIQILPRKDFSPSTDITNNYTYDVLAFHPSAGTVTIDFATLRESIEETHPMHCILGGVAIAIGFWAWDDPTKPLDDVLYVTDFTRVASANFKTQFRAVTLENGNAFKINNFIDGTARNTVLYPSANGDMKIRLGECNNLIIGGKKFAFSEFETADIVPPVSGSETQLLYVINNSGVLETHFANSLFTAGMPETYYDIIPSMFPIAEIVVNSTDTEILQSQITDVRPIN